jgi:sphingomyelin phosphodiesterase 2
MTDSWLETHADTMADTIARYERGQLSASDCIRLFGVTCDSPLDTWTQHDLKQEPYAKDIGDRLDYIFYRRTPQITCQQSKVAMEQYIPQTQMSFSDHFAVHSVFTITTDANRALANELDAPLAPQLARPDYSLLKAETLDEMIAVLQLDLAKVTTTANRLLFLCGISVFLVFALYVMQIVLPYYYNYSEVAILASSILCGLLLIVFSMLAIVCLVVGFVFGKMEQRSLRQYLIDITVCADMLENKNDTKQHTPQVPTVIHSKHYTAFKNGPCSLNSSRSSYSTSDGFVIKNIKK